MNEIIVKALDEFSDQWIYGQAFFIDFDNNQGYIANGISDHHCVKKETICQFTGLRDKNEKDIYFDHGGIHPENGPYIVKNGKWIYSEIKEYNILLHGPHIEWMRKIENKLCSKNILTWIEAGLTFDMNIYENPELSIIKKE